MTEQEEESFYPKLKKISNYCKFGSGIDEVGRVGRLNRAEKAYRQTRTHEGKKKTLRDHRK